MKAGAAVAAVSSAPFAFGGCAVVGGTAIRTAATTLITRTAAKGLLVGLVRHIAFAEAHDLLEGIGLDLSDSALQWFDDAGDERALVCWPVRDHMADGAGAYTTLQSLPVAGLGAMTVFFALDDNELPCLACVSDDGTSVVVEPTAATVLAAHATELRKNTAVTDADVAARIVPLHRSAPQQLELISIGESVSIETGAGRLKMTLTADSGEGRTVHLEQDGLAWDYKLDHHFRT